MYIYICILYEYIYVGGCAYLYIVCIQLALHIHKFQIEVTKGRLYHAISYKGPEHSWILVSLGILEPSPCEYRGIQTLYTACVCVCVCVCVYTHMFIYTHTPESVIMGISVGIAKHLPTPCVAYCIYMIQSMGERSGRKGLSENQGGFPEKRLLCRPLREMEDRRQEWGQVQSSTESLTCWTEELVLWSHQTCYH